jgi:hypothetical protein
MPIPGVHERRIIRGSDSSTNVGVPNGIRRYLETGVHRRHRRRLIGFGWNPLSTYTLSSAVSLLLPLKPMVPVRELGGPSASLRRLTPFAGHPTAVESGYADGLIKSFIKFVARPGSRTECLTSIVSAAGSAKNTRSAVAAQRLRAPGTQCMNLGARGGVGRFRLEHLTIGQQSA